MTEEIHEHDKILIPTTKSNFFADKNIVHGKGNLNENPSKLNDKLQLTDRSVSVMDGDKIETLNINKVLNENTEKSRKEKFSEFKDLLNEILVKNENSSQEIQNELKKSISSFEKSLSKKFEKKQSREDVENELKKLKGDIENLDKNIGVLNSKLKSLEERKHGKIFVILSVVSAIAIAAFGVAGIMGGCIGFGVLLLGFAIAAIVKFKNASSDNAFKKIENDLLKSLDNLSLENAFVEKFEKVEKKLDEIISLIEAVRDTIGTFNSIEEEAGKAIGKVGNSKQQGRKTTITLEDIRKLDNTSCSIWKLYESAKNAKDAFDLMGSICDKINSLVNDINKMHEIYDKMTYLNNSEEIDKCIQSFNKKIFRSEKVKNGKKKMIRTYLYSVVLLNELHNGIAGRNVINIDKTIREPGFMEHAKSCLTLFNEVQSQNKPSFN